MKSSHFAAELWKVENRSLAMEAMPYNLHQSAPGMHHHGLASGPDASMYIQCACDFANVPAERTILHQILTGKGYHYAAQYQQFQPHHVYTGYHHHHHHHPHHHHHHSAYHHMDTKAHSQEMILPSRYTYQQADK